MVSTERNWAATQMARLEYKYYTLAIFLIVAALLYFVSFSEEQSGFVRAVFSLAGGWATTSLLRIFYYPRKLLKEFSEEQLRRRWLSLGGFSDK